LVDRGKPHQLHQPFDTLAINQVALSSKPRRHAARTVKWRAQVLAVDERHQLQLIGADFDWVVVERRAVQTQEHALAPERK
jgi:hypothetical protein